MTALLSPRWILLAAIVTFFSGTFSLVTGVPHPMREGLVSIVHVAAYAAGIYLAGKIAAEHRSSASVQLAWNLIGLSSGFSLIRHTAFLLHGFQLLNGMPAPVYYLITQLPMALAVLSFLAGLISMWCAFSALGLGFHARRVDIALLILIVLLMPPILLSRGLQNPSELTSSIYLLRYAGPLLLPACAGIAVLLHRIAYQMRGGDMSRALLCLIAYPVLRLIAALLALNPGLRQIQILYITQASLMQIVPLLFTLGLAYRWQITVRASRAFRLRPEWNSASPSPVVVN